MPTLAAQENAALETLRLYAQPDIPPVIDSTELTAILADTSRAVIWTIATAYIVGDVILPTVRNGHRYRCVQAGTSAALLADEPTWAVWQGFQATDGVSDPILTWVEDGPDFDNVYDVRAAIHAAWMLKAGKASILADVSQQVGGIRSSQVYEHCIAQADKYRPVKIA